MFWIERSSKIFVHQLICDLKTYINYLLKWNERCWTKLSCQFFCIPICKLQIYLKKHSLWFWIQFWTLQFTRTHFWPIAFVTDTQLCVVGNEPWFGEGYTVKENLLRNLRPARTSPTTNMWEMGARCIAQKITFIRNFAQN